MAEPTIADKREILIAWLENQGVKDAKQQVMSWSDKIVNEKYTAVISKRESALDTADIAKESAIPDKYAPNRLGTVAPRLGSQYAPNANSIPQPNNFKIPEGLQNLNKSTTDTSGIQGAGLAVLNKTKNMINTMKGLVMSPTNSKKIDPCAHLSGAAKASCYLYQKQEAVFEGEEELASMYESLYQAAKADYDMMREKDADEFTKTQERQRILENIQTLRMSGAANATSAMTAGQNNLRSMLNEGIVMAPGQEYLWGQEPGGNRERILKKFDVPYQAQKFPTIPMDFNAPADYMKQQTAEISGELYNQSNQQSSPGNLTPNDVGSLDNKLGVNAFSGGGVQPRGQETKNAPPVNIGKTELAYLEKQLPYAVKASQATGLPISWILAMGANETGWGTVGEGVPFGIKDYSGKGTVLKTIEGGNRETAYEPFKIANDIQSGYDDYIWEMANPKSRWAAAPRNDLNSFLSYLQGGNPEGVYWADDTVNKKSTGQYMSQITSLVKQIEAQLEKRFPEYLPVAPQLDVPPTQPAGNNLFRNYIQ